MAQERAKRSAITYAGYQYQTLQGIRLLAEWLSSPTRYFKIRFECDDDVIAPQGIDDIVVCRSDERLDFYQVKYTVSPDKHSLCWDWLLEVNTSSRNLRSLLRKCFDAVNKVDPQVLGEVRLITNRIPDREFERCLRGKRLDYSQLSSEVKAKIDEQLGGESEAQTFLNTLEIQHSDKNYLSLENELNSVLRNFTDDTGIERLKNKANGWAIFKGEPEPDGWITLDTLRSVLSTVRPEAISEDFVIPDSYNVPDEEFHRQLLEDIKNSQGKVFTIVGPPGRGKSTYLSVLCQELAESEIPTIRHHYFLSVRDRTRDRLSPYVVAESFLSQIDRFHSKAGAVVPRRIEDLNKSLEDCAVKYRAQHKPFVVVIDGLDHVWRDNSQDKRPLDEIFNQLLPLVPNLVLVVGMQPVDDEKLPERLLLESPRTNWRELPPMSGNSVLAYLQFQVEAKRVHFPREQDQESQLIECGQSLHRLTRGHPLHVIYSIEELAGSNTPLSTWKIEELPTCPGDNIRDYYRSLWMRLMHVERDVLHLLCAFPFYWPIRTFNEMDLDSENLPVSIRRVEHLLKSTSAGLKPFHESLIVFVKEQSDHMERVGALAPKVETWLRKYAPEILRESWLWTLQAQNGNTKPLREGLTRDWVLDRLANGYPVDTPVRLLSEAEDYAFQEKDYSGAYRLRALKTRLLNGPEFQIDDQSRLRSCSWKLSNDPLVLEDAFASRHELSTKELSTLGLAINWLGNTDRGRMIIREALNRHRGEWRFAEIRYAEASKETVSLVRGCTTLAANYLDWVIRDKLCDKWPIEWLKALVSALAAEQRLESLIALRSSIEHPERAKLVEDTAVRVASLAGGDLSAWNEFKSFNASCLPDCWAIAKGTPLDRIFIPNGSLSVNLFEGHYFDEQKFRVVVHEWFFGSVLTKLIASGEFCCVPAQKFESRPNLSTYLDNLALFANVVAIKILSRQAVDFSEPFLFFDRVQIPGPKGFDESQAYESFRRALLQVAIDCHLLSSAGREETRINSSSMRRAGASHWFNLSAFRSWYVEAGLQILTDEAADYVVRTGQSELLSKIKETKQTVDALLELCELSLMHRLASLAAPICRLCWDFVLGYDSHKDPTILNVLTAIEYCADVEPARAKEALFQIAPQIHHITEYTDGDGTRYAHSYASEILCKVDQLSFMSQYKEFIEEGNWYRADEALVEFFESADLTSPIIEGLMRTGLSSSVMAVLSKRAEGGDMTANRLLLIAALHMGVNVSTFGSEPQGGSNTQLSEFAGNPDDYPPEKFDVLLADMTASHTFSAYKYLPKWYEHWKSKGQESLLLQVLTGRLLGEESRRGDTHYMLDQLFESCVRLKGKRKAFDIAVKAQIELGGWLDYFEQSEKTESRLRRVAQLYPERADEFIAKSASNWLTSRRQPSTLIIPGEKLVFFLVQLGRLDEAFGLVQSMLDCLKEDTRNLDLSLPTWAQVNMSAILLDKAEITLLLTRLKWPLPGSKWWAMQELADLLADSRYQAQVEESLKAELVHCRFETEVVELLFVFWMAQTRGYVAQPILSDCVMARSVLSSLLLSEISPESSLKGDLSSPFLLAPTEFTPNEDFIAAQGRAVPLMFITKLKELEQETDFPFTAQYAFEWARSLARVPSQDHCVDYFLDSPRDEMTGQFVTQDSHRGRSAYLRTILIAKEFWEMPDSWATHLSLLALPINPTLADLCSGKPPWLHEWGFQGPATTESVAAYVTNAIDTCNRRSDNKVLAALSFPIRLSENEILDLNLTLWAQWRDADVNVTMLLSKDPHGYNGGFEGDGLVRPSTFSVGPSEELRDDVSSSAPAAGRLFPFRYGYLHTDIESRGWYVPLCTRANSKIRIQPSSNRLEFVEDKTTLGETGYWNAGWAPCHPKGCEPFCGTYLTLNNEHLPSFWDEPPTSYFYLWECKKLQRKQSHNSYNRECYGGIVRYDMTNGKS